MLHVLQEMSSLLACNVQRGKPLWSLNTAARLKLYDFCSTITISITYNIINHPWKQHYRPSATVLQITLSCGKDHILSVRSIAGNSTQSVALKRQLTVILLIPLSNVQILFSKDMTENVQPRSCCWKHNIKRFSQISHRTINCRVKRPKVDFDYRLPRQLRMVELPSASCYFALTGFGTMLSRFSVADLTKLSVAPEHPQSWNPV